MASNSCGYTRNYNYTDSNWFHKKCHPVTLPEVVTSIDVPETSFEFSVARETLATVDGTDSSYVCGTDTQTTYGGGGSGADTTKGCVVGTVFTLTLPTSADELYLHADGLTTSFQLAGITTTFVPKQTIFGTFQSVVPKPMEGRDTGSGVCQARHKTKKSLDT